jgi:hypothetical protein
LSTDGITGRLLSVSLHIQNQMCVAVFHKE